MEDNKKVLLKVENLSQHFKMGPKRELKAVDAVSFDVYQGEVFGLVGESGCGKTTTGRSIIKLYDITSGNVYFKGQRICAGTRSYKDAIKAAKKQFAADKNALALELNQKISEQPERKVELTEEFNQAIARKKAELKEIVQKNKDEIRAAKDDHKHCEKKYVEQLKGEYDEAVNAVGGNPEDLSEEDKKKFLPVKTLPKIPKLYWLIGMFATFVAAIVLLTSTILIRSSFSKKYGEIKRLSVEVVAVDAEKKTTDVKYTVIVIENNIPRNEPREATLNYYDPELPVSGDGFTSRLTVYYGEKTPDDLMVQKPKAQGATATLILFLCLTAAGFIVLVYVHERYNPTRLITKIQMIFQDPIASLNPRMTVRDIIAEGLIIEGVKDKRYIDEQVFEVLRLVGLVPEHAGRYPHEFSGGQRQRIGVARSVIMKPELIIADEPISALDVSIQAQVINLLNELREKLGLTILFIAHDLSVVKYFSDRIGVMYFGKMVELATSDELFANPLHPYTRSLLSAIPLPDPNYEKKRKRFVYNPLAEHDYSVDQPTMREVSPGHFVYCNQAEFEKYTAQLAGEKAE